MREINKNKKWEINFCCPNENCLFNGNVKSSKIKIYEKGDAVYIFLRNKFLFFDTIHNFLPTFRFEKTYRTYYSKYALNKDIFVEGIVCPFCKKIKPLVNFDLDSLYFYTHRNNFELIKFECMFKDE